MTRYDTYARLEPRPGDRDLQRGFEAAVHDPCWFLARQWQMGEHQGENASTPLVVNYRLDAARIGPPAGWDGFDPTLSPADAAVEAERDDWWTMGRRVGAGQRVGASARAEARAAAADPRSRFRTPPPPYGRFDGRPDGLALWHLRAALGLTPADFGPDAPPADRPEAWQPDRLVYDQDYPAGGATLSVRDHRGDALDWYSADASADFTPDEVGPPRRVLLAPLEYPGAPNPRWWQIEDPATDVGGYPPDPAHFPTMLLIDLISSHGDDWFMVPVSARAGRAVVLAEFSVRDSFGHTYERSGPGGEGLQPPPDWHLFRCRGAAAGALVLWNVAELPLEGPVLERVQFGIDEAANLLWAVERVVGGREFAAREVPPIDPVAHPAYPAAAPSGDATRERRWAYVPGESAPPGWHPYALDEAAAGDRAFAQHRLVDYSRHGRSPSPRRSPPPKSSGPAPRSRPPSTASPRPRSRPAASKSSGGGCSPATASATRSCGRRSSADPCVPRRPAPSGTTASPKRPTPSDPRPIAEESTVPSPRDIRLDAFFEDEILPLTPLVPNPRGVAFNLFTNLLPSPPAPFSATLNLTNPLDPTVNPGLSHPEVIPVPNRGVAREYSIFVPPAVFAALRLGFGLAPPVKVTLLYSVGSEYNRHGLRTFFAGATDRVLVTGPGIEADSTTGNQAWGVGITPDMINQLFAATGLLMTVNWAVDIVAGYSTGYRGVNGTVLNGLVSLDGLRRVLFYDALYWGDDPKWPAGTPALPTPAGVAPSPGGSGQNTWRMLDAVRAANPAVEVVAYEVTEPGGTPRVGGKLKADVPASLLVNLKPLAAALEALILARVLGNGVRDGYFAMPAALAAVARLAASLPPRGTLASSPLTASRATSGTLQAWAAANATDVASAAARVNDGVALIRTHLLMGWPVPSAGEMLHDGFLQEFGWEFLLS